MKNKINLSDYNFARDIENRLIMSQLTVFEVEVLREIIDGSLKFTVRQLAEALDSTEKILTPILDKLSRTKLLQRYGNQVIVDKEMRKYYVVQILKFDENFVPDMDFLQSLLSKVPIQVLPVWYAISRLSDNIFLSIVEKHFSTPKVYEKYLQEIQFDDPLLGQILIDVFSAPDFIIEANVVREKYNLSHEQFEKAILLLEYNLVCCLSYQRMNDRWQEVLTPFHEWREYLRFLQATTPPTIEAVSQIKRRHAQDFGFINSLAECLEELLKGPISLKRKHPKFSKQLLMRVLKLNLGKISENELHAIPSTEHWLSLSLHDRAIMLYRQPLDAELCILYAEKDIREIERSLKRVLRSGWIYFDDFIKGMTASVCSAEAIAFKNKGKRWKYVVPTYNQDELELIKATLFERLYEAGIIAVGTHKERPCFAVTPFGQVTLGD